MTTRTAKKILHRWSTEFSPSQSPRVAHEAGELPWNWSTWSTAHRVWFRHVARRVGR